MELNPVQRSNLQALLFNPGWDVLLDLMEAECQILETECFQAPPHDVARVLASHNTARAARTFFERFQKAVQQAAKNPDELSPIPSNLTPMDIMKAQLRSIS